MKLNALLECGAWKTIDGKTKLQLPGNIVFDILAEHWYFGWLATLVRNLQRVKYQYQNCVHWFRFFVNYIITS